MSQNIYLSNNCRIGTGVEIIFVCKEYFTLIADGSVCKETIAVVTQRNSLYKEVVKGITDSYAGEILVTEFTNELMLRRIIVIGSRNCWKKTICL